jgi:hypothetical protein
MSTSFIRTITINGRPLVLRFNKVSDSEFEVRCINDRQVADIKINYEEAKWIITGGGNEEIRHQEGRILGLLEVEHT